MVERRAVNPCQRRFNPFYSRQTWGCNSVGECQLCKLEVEGSNPFSSTTQAYDVTASINGSNPFCVGSNPTAPAKRFHRSSARTLACHVRETGSTPVGTAIRKYLGAKRPQKGRAVK